MPRNGSDNNDSGDASADMAERQRYLLEEARRAREEARRARRLADTQTQADVIGELRSYAGQLEHEAFLREQQAAEFASTLAVTRRLTEEIRGLADEARDRLEQMKERLTKPAGRS